MASVQLSQSSTEPMSEYERLREQFPRELDYQYEPWRYPLWQVANRPELFAYKARNRKDGICLIERINLPDGRIVMAMIQVAGNPGNSITNTVETICYQLCERFQLQPDRVVWLQHYDYNDRADWTMVSFKREPPDRPFEDPAWDRMTPELWDDLGLQPKMKLRHKHGSYESKLTKRFRWSAQDLF
jgi:hypothetical protein